MPETEIRGTRFMINRMNVFDQMHVARKVAPIWFGMGQGYAAALQKIASNSGLVPTMNGEDAQNQGEDNEEAAAARSTIMFETMVPISEILAKMPEDDVNYVVKKCLGACQKYTGTANGAGGSWVPLMRGGQLMFEDTDLSTLITLTMEVVQDNLGPSLSALFLPSSPAAEPDSPSNSPA